MTRIAPAGPVLDGRHVRLEPLTREHHTELCDVGLDPELWRWTVSQPRTPDQLLAYIDAALAAHATGDAIPFLVRDQASGRAIGSTRYGNIDSANRRLEIGWTWIAAPWQRTPANTEAKLLLLTHAFEQRDCIRVEFKTDVLNTKSRAALLRIGAVQEGIFRSHIICESGRIRDTVYFSIIATEWPAVKATLVARLQADGPAHTPG